MKLAVLDINGSRVRAVTGADGSVPQILALDGTRLELATAIRLAGRRSEAGQAAVAICRQYPHLTCAGFLASLDEDQPRPTRQGELSPEQALALVVAHLRESLASCDHLGLCLPGYLRESQAMKCRAAFAKTRLRVLGAIPSAVALAVAARADDDNRACATIEVDCHGLTFGYVDASEHGLRLADHHVIAELGMNAWWEALLDGIAEICIRQNRRDFRDSGVAEQGVFGQLDDVISAASKGELIEIVIRTKQWCQNLILRPDQIAAMCEPLAVRAANALADWLQEKAPRSCQVIVSDEAARHPGLKAAVQDEAKGMEVVEVNTTKALSRVHAQASRWAGADAAKLWHCLAPAAAPPKSANNDRVRSLRIRWR